MASHTELARVIEAVATAEGTHPSVLPGVMLTRIEKTIPRTPLMYKPCIIVIAQGSKRVWLGDEHYEYDANNYLVLAAPMPLDCETMVPSDKPLLGVTIGIDPVMVGELLLEIDDHALGGDGPRLVGATSVTDDVIDSTTRLVKALASPLSARILGEQIVREIVFHVLQGPQGDTLRLLAASSGRYGQLARVMRRIHEEYASDLDVASLAREANMALSTFHHAFREMTSTSPLQYIKQTRLHRARTLLATEGVSAQEAAFRVGYSSPSQFGREYRRMFGNSPASDRALTTV